MFDHIGIVVSDLDGFVNKITSLLGGVKVEQKKYEDMRVVFLKINGVKLEIIQPLSPKNRYWSEVVSKKGLHHISFRADNKRDVLNKIKETGLKISYLVEGSDYILINLDETLLDGVIVQFIISKNL